MTGKYTIWDRIDSICQETANQMKEMCPLAFGFPFMLGGFVCAVVTEGQNITSQKEFYRLTAGPFARAFLIMLAVTLLICLFYSWFVMAPTKSDIETILHDKENSAFLFSGHAFHIRDGLAEEGWLFVTNEDIIYVAPTARMSVIDTFNNLCGLVNPENRANIGKSQNKERRLNRSMIEGIKRKHQYIPSNKIVITLNGGWDITFSVREKEAFLSCFEKASAAAVTA